MLDVQEALKKKQQDEPAPAKANQAITDNEKDDLRRRHTT